MKSKSLLIISGILLTIIGVLFLVLPEATLLIYTKFIGIALIVYSLMKFVGHKNRGNLFFDIFMMIIYVILGLLLFTQPLSTLFDVIYVSSIFMFLQGVTMLVSLIYNKEFGLNPFVFVAVIMIVLSLIILMNPFVVIVIASLLPYMVGFGFMYAGITEIIFSSKYLTE